MPDINITEKPNEVLSLEQIRLVSKGIFIVDLLLDLHKQPDEFSLESGHVIYDNYFKSKAISKAEILKWQHATDGGEKDLHMSSEEFDILINMCPRLNSIKAKDDCTYYCLRI